MSKGLNRMLRIYVELDSLFDFRRGLVQKQLVAGKRFNSDAERVIEADRLWEMYVEKRYRKRVLDVFDIPELNVSTEQYRKDLKARTITDFEMYHPSAIEKSMFKMIMDLEMMEDTTPSIKGATLYVNTFPYLLDDELNAQLRDSVSRRFGGRYGVEIVHSDPSAFTALTYGQYDYVFKYDILLGNYEWFLRSLMDTQIPGTTFIVPSLFHEMNEMVKGTPEDMIYAVAPTLSPAVKIVPCSVEVYDYPKV